MAIVHPFPDLVTDVVVAELLGLSTKTLANWRATGRGPAYYKLGGGRVRYDRQVVLAWLTDALVA